MAKWNFTASNGQLVATLTPESGDVELRQYTFKEASIRMAVGKIKFFESGVYVFATLFTAIGEIDGVEPTDLADASTKLTALIPSSSGGTGGGNYNTVTVYDTTEELPITFASETIHSISMLCLTGTFTVTVNGEETVLSAGENMDIEATTLIADEISLDSTTGTFKVTTLD